MTARVCVLGPSGKMGRAVISAAAGRGDVAIASAVDRTGAAGLGEPVVPGVVATADLEAGLAAADVYVDFTAPDATRAAATAALARRVPAVIGTTGLGADDEAAIAALAAVAPVVVAANFSLGVNLVLGLVRTAARVLGPDWDAEVVETHHRAKRDAPSGTALMIARAIAAGHGSSYDEVKRHTRDGDIGPRPRGEIGVATVRGGDVIGEHTATFFGAAERIEIGHRATSRAIFAAGALRAAAWVVGKPPGRYDMLAVLGLS
ncbi:MAG: 4-hydroxy-tetrahydrodipicolinate reductase [Deltaproteobacteria bacterium]|nr:4-hydroxy-tetrahydrodipicolinate reductase [Deltaproteobacteria bacterium]MCW5802562.1 4-hydroxy-tetrahydrodipicolinate reductase [Deltaproteobacteria bacterium]